MAFKIEAHFDPARNKLMFSRLVTEATSTGATCKLFSVNHPISN